VHGDWQYVLDLGAVLRAAYLTMGSNDVRARVRRYAASNPTEARELCDRFVNDNDYAAMHAFIATIKSGER
jgi:hypothetical protein